MKLNKYQNKLIFEYKTITEKFDISENISNKSIEVFSKLEKDYKRLTNLLSIKQLSQVPTEKEHELIHGYDPEVEKQDYHTNEHWYN